MVAYSTTEKMRTVVTKIIKASDDAANVATDSNRYGNRKTCLVDHFLNKVMSRMYILPSSANPTMR
jgi:hypothetical protein